MDKPGWGSETALQCERERLVRLCAHLSGDADVAEDLAQETLAEAWRHRHRLHDETGRGAWLAAIARNICLRSARTRGRERARTLHGEDGTSIALDGVVLDGVSLEDDLEHGELADLLDRAMSYLPVENRRVLVQRYIEGRSYAEIAASLGLSEGAVAMRLQRGKRALRRVLTAELRDEAHAYGPEATDEYSWQPTRIWCPTCGQATLRCRISRAETTFVAACTACRTEIRDRSASYLGTVKGQWRTLIRSFREAHAYFRGALAAGAAPCACCGGSAPLRMGLPAEEVESRSTSSGVHVRCSACGAVSFQPAGGLTLTLPEVERFWREQKRIRMLPSTEITIDGRPALVTPVRSVTGRSSLEIVALRDSFEVLAIHRSTGP